MTDERLASKRAAKAEAKTKQDASEEKPAGPRFEVIGAAAVADVMSPKGKLLKCRENLPLDSYPGTGRVLRTLGGGTELIDQKIYIRGIAAPCCGLLVNKVTGLPFLRMQRGSFHSNRRLSRPDQISSACTCTPPWSGQSADLLQHHFEGDPAGERAWYKQHAGGSMPQLSRKVAARHNGEIVIRYTDAEAAKAVLPPDHDNTVELLAIDAYSDQRALNIAMGSADLPWKRVKVTDTGDVVELGWHGLRTTSLEEERHAKIVSARRKAVQDQLDAEVRDFRRRRESELSL